MINKNNQISYWVTHTCFGLILVWVMLRPVVPFSILSFLYKITGKLFYTNHTASYTRVPESVAQKWNQSHDAMGIVPGTKGLGWILSHYLESLYHPEVLPCSGLFRAPKSTHPPLSEPNTFSPLTSKASWSAPGSHSLAVSRVSRTLKSNQKAQTFWYRLVYIPPGMYLHQSLKWVNYHAFPAHCCLECAASESQSHWSKEEQL